MMGKAIWTTKAGEKIPVCKMGDDHLRNTIWLLLRRAAFAKPIEEYRALRAANSVFPGTMAEDQLEGLALSLQDMDDHEYASVRWQIFDDLVEEAFKRGLDLDSVREEKRREALSLAGFTAAMEDAREGKK